MSRISFIQREEYEMQIEPADGYSVAEIVAGLNMGKYEIDDGKETITDVVTKADRRVANSLAIYLSEVNEPKSDRLKWYLDQLQVRVKWARSLPASPASQTP